VSGSGHGKAAGAALAHVAIATEDADALAMTLATALGGERAGEETIDGGGLRVVFVKVGQVLFELLEPRSDAHTVAKFLAKRGAGLHHVSLEVPDVAAALERARAAGVKLVDESPRAGAHGSRVAFLHPASLGGVLLELSETPEKRRR
jgi:methylmalonyl-CoA epimerase